MLDNFLNKTVVTDNIAEHQKLHITNTLGLTLNLLFKNNIELREKFLQSQ